MAVRTPPSWQQNSSHPAENDRLSQQALYATTGIIGTSSLAVTQNSTPGMSVQIAAGWAAILGTYQANMGVYTVYNDAATVATITTAPATNSRIDSICLTVNDAAYSGILNNVIVNVVAGTVAASPVPPTIPVNSIELARVTVGTAVTSILNANITDTRVPVTSNAPFITLTGTQTLTNKTLTTPVIAQISNTGLITLPVSTDTLVGRATTDTLTNKTLTTPVISSISNTGVITLPTSTDTLVARSTSDTLANKSLIGPFENWYVVASAFAGYTANIQTNGGVHYLTTASTANGVVNFRSSATATLNSVLAVGQAVTVVVGITNTTAFYITGVQVDGTSVTPKYATGTAPVAGNSNGVDWYQFTIVKTAATPTYTVFQQGPIKYA